MQQQSARCSRNRPCVLVVEDDASINYMLQDVLDMEGYHVISVDSGRAALTQLLNDASGADSDAACHPIDLILLDLQMPEMNGEDVIAQAAALGYTPPPIVVLSARREHAVETAASAIGATEFLLKPFQIEELLASVQRALQPVI